MGKLLEKIIAVRLTHHLHSHDILLALQLGFCEKYSSELAVNNLYEKIATYH